MSEKARKQPGVQPAPGTVRVLHVLPSLFGGGMERAAVRLVRASTQASEAAPPQTGIVHGTCILRDGDESLIEQCRACGPTWVLGQGQGEGKHRDFRSWWRLRFIVRSFRPDVVHARSTGVWLDAALATRGRDRPRLLLSFHGRTSLAPVGRWRRFVNRWATRRADAVLAVSGDAARMMERAWNVPAHKLQVIPNGVDAHEFQPEANVEAQARTRQKLGLAAADHVVICVGNLYPIKGMDVLLRAWRQVSMVDPAARLVIVGEGPMRGDLEQLAAALRVAATVRFLGAREDVAALLRCADLFALPSRSEGCNNAVLEAMATGLPVVASDVGGMPELITPNRTGWLVPPDAPDRLAEVILAALLDRPARQRIGQAARAVAVEQFGLDRWAARYAWLYRQLAAPRAAPSARIREEDAVCAG